MHALPLLACTVGREAGDESSHACTPAARVHCRERLVCPYGVPNSNHHTKHTRVIVGTPMGLLLRGQSARAGVCGRTGQFCICGRGGERGLGPERAAAGRTAHIGYPLGILIQSV